MNEKEHIDIAENYEGRCAPHISDRLDDRYMVM